eukprot:436707-Hanusia_phi.AAC.4
MTLVLVIMIVGGYLGTVSIVTTVKWFWFVISMALFVVVLYALAVQFRDAALQKGNDRSDVYGRLAWLTIVSWIFYP